MQLTRAVRGAKHVRMYICTSYVAPGKGLKYFRPGTFRGNPLCLGIAARRTLLYSFASCWTRL